MKKNWLVGGVLLCIYVLHTNHIYAQQEQTYEVDTQVVSENQKPMEGASFYLYKDGGLYVDHIQSDTKGNVKIKNLPEGSYALYQQASMYGYDVSDMRCTFVIDEKTKPKLRLENIKNTRLYGDVKIVLDDDIGNKITHTKVAIEAENGTTIDSLTSDMKGVLLVKHLPIGTYYMKVIDDKYTKHNKDGVSFTITPYNYQKDVKISICLKIYHPTFMLQDYTFTISFMIILLIAIGCGIIYFRKHSITQFFDDFML